jgi:hypothetical protein
VAAQAQAEAEKVCISAKESFELVRCVWVAFQQCTTQQHYTGRGL